MLSLNILRWLFFLFYSANVLNYVDCCDKLTCHIRIGVDLPKSIKIHSTEISHLPHIQHPLLLISYTGIKHLSQLKSQY